MKLMPGNGVDLIADYSTNLKVQVERAEVFAETFRQ